MTKKFLHRFEMILLVLLSCLGIVVSSIGVTWCRYQVNHEENVQFIVKGEGEYYVVPEQTALINEEHDNNQTISFSVFNTVTDEVPTTAHRFHVRWNSTTKQEVSLFVKELSGREKEYAGVMIKASEGLYTYAFVDEDKKEALLIHPANEISEKQCRLVIKNPVQSFGSEIMIIDDAYESEHQNTFTTHEIPDFKLSSNYFTKETNEIILVEDEIILTMNSNRDVSTRMYIINEHENLTASINDLQEMDVELTAGVETKISFKLEKKEPAEEQPEQGEIVPGEPEDSQTPEEETVELEVTEEPGTSEQEETTEPEVTDDPVQEEENTELLTLEETPGTTEEPVVTETPESTVDPEPTVTPESTPEPTVTPESTETPEVTPTLEPEVTDSPEPTVTPETTVTPGVTESPESSETPETTPEVSEEPEEVETELQTVTVVWEILDSEGNKTDEYHAVFTLMSENNYSEEVSLEMTSDKETFNQFQTVNLTLNIDKETSVSLNEGEGFPEKTRYSLDKGNTWMMLSKKGSIDLNLKQSATCMIDFSKTDLVVEERDYIVTASINDTIVSQLDLKMEVKDVDLFEITQIRTGIITNEPVSFKLSHNNVSIYLEKLVGDEYVWFDKEIYLNWIITEDLFHTVSIKEDADLPNGNYRIILSQTVDNTIVKYVELPFYAMGR